MHNFVNGTLGRVITLQIGRGERLLESIMEALQEADIHNAVLLGAIGSLQKTVFHRVVTKAEAPQDEYITCVEPVEISSMQGVVLNGQPHFHLVFSSVHETYTGHLEPETEALYLVEVTLAEIQNCDCVRVKDELGVASFQKLEGKRG